jgi:WhiB family redox-sensing transcriptional regulator
MWLDHTMTRAQYFASQPSPAREPNVSLPLPIRRTAPEPDKAWMAEAACKGKTAVMYPAIKGDVGLIRQREAAAIAVCTECPVKVECARWALDHEEMYGVWGGLTERERQRMLGRFRDRRRHVT